ncbi:MAG TPA: site-specific DNA-methyltransferase [Candidatus Saccharicenans sp.]|nr:site-specific DNA-methyltransferase [Candidatus Saccharicenans sp.]
MTTEISITGKNEVSVMSLEVNRVYNFDALTGLRQLEAESVDTIITSPPYYGLRDYGKAQTIFGGQPDCDHHWMSGVRPGMSGGPNGDTTQRRFPEIPYASCSKCGAWLGQLGLEPCPEDYIDHLVMVFQECWRVLKPAGALWVVIGDSYAGSGIGTNDYRTPASRSINKTSKPHPKISVTQKLKSVKAKSLILIPHRFALAMSEAGWIVRNEIIWHKPNSMPESVTDRFSRDFEHIYFFTKRPRYYFQQLLEPVTESSLARVRQFVKNGESFDPARHKTDPTRKVQTSMEVLANAAEKLLKYPYRNKRTVWRISPGGFCQIHFAVFPEALIEPMIQSTCPPAICTKCGHPYRKVLRQINRAGGEQKENQVDGAGDDMCSCGAETKPGLVVDPFMGSGTTGAVALKLGREFIGFELNPDYVKFAEDRIEKVKSGLQLGFNFLSGANLKDSRKERMI